MTNATASLIKPGEGAKELELKIERIGVASDGKNRLIKFAGLADVVTFTFDVQHQDDAHTPEEDVILALPGDLVRASLRYRFGRICASGFRNLSMRTPVFAMA